LSASALVTTGDNRDEDEAMTNDEIQQLKDADAAMRAKLHAMWTPEIIDGFESDVRALLRMNDRLTEQEPEEIVTALKQKAMEELTPPAQVHFP
jgi:hypothetical protein